MAVRVGINGVGRIGRNLWRIIHTAAPDLQVVATNDTADLAMVAHLLRYASLRGRFPATVDSVCDGDGDALIVGGTTVPLTHVPTPTGIDWAAHGVDLVVEATGQFTTGPTARGHLAGGVPTVIISTASPDADVSLMMGVNEQLFDPDRHRVVSNSCCTTYCLAAMAKPLHRAFGVTGGTATIAYSHGSRPGPLLDGVHHNLRLARANATNIVPVNVPGVRYALDRVLPELAGRIAATALRVPVRGTSAATLTLRLAHPVQVAEVNAILRAASSGLSKGYLEVSHDPLVSCDMLGATASCVVDAGLTAVLGDLVRVVGWYDNEWGYAHRLVDLIRHIARCSGTPGRSLPVPSDHEATAPPATPP
jgi:glyceraldehyde 3-phosphate dehydrogenase